MLDALFNPESIALIGAAREPDKVGHSILKNLIEFSFKGDIYPINPKARELLGLKVYPSILDVANDVEQAIIAIPPNLILDVLPQCAKKGIKVAIVITAGFKEAGGDGTRLEEELKDRAKGLGIRLLGPNCLGIINTKNNLNATFAAGMLPRGEIAFFSQSGALGIAILDWAVGNRVGFSKFISLGNKADLSEIDMIEYLANDPDTKVILGYIEGVVDGRRFLDVASNAVRSKPIIIVKAGGTSAGARAASSHTGALAGSEQAFSAAFKQTGILRVEGIEDLFETAKAFASCPMPGGSRLLILTNAGGPGILAAPMRAMDSGLKSASSIG